MEIRELTQNCMKYNKIDSFRQFLQALSGKAAYWRAVDREYARDLDVSLCRHEVDITYTEKYWINILFYLLQRCQVVGKRKISIVFAITQHAAQQSTI